MWSLENRSHVGIRGPKILWGRWGPATLEWGDVTPRNMLLPHLSYRANFGHSRSNHSSLTNYGDPQIWPVASRLSRSLEVIGTDSDQSATYDFLLVFYGPVSYRFRDKRRYLRNFPTPLYLRPRWNSTLEFCNGGEVKKLEWRKQVWRYVHSFRHSRPTGIGQTDGQTELVKQYRALHAYADER